MSILTDHLAERRAAKSTGCLEIEAKSVSMIAVCPWQSKEWAIPWSRLDALSFCHDGDLERLELFFTHHHIVIIGESIQRALEDFRSFNVRRVRDFPASHRVSVDLREPWISKLDVILLADPKAAFS